MGAAALCREALALRRALGHGPDIATSLAHLAALAWEQGDSGRAVVSLREGLALVRGSGARAAATLCLANLARVTAAALGNLAGAARLYGATAVGPATRWPPSAWDERPAHTLQVAALRATLGEAAFTAAWAQGQALTLEQAISEAVDTPVS